MRLLLALLLASCAAPAFQPARVYVVAPCAVEKQRHEEMAVGLNIATLHNDITDADRAHYCESRSQMPTVACSDSTTMRYDGCRWACRPWFSIDEQPPATVEIDVGGYRVEAEE